MRHLTSSTFVRTFLINPMWINRRRVGALHCVYRHNYKKFPNRLDFKRSVGYDWDVDTNPTNTKGVL